MKNKILQISFLILLFLIFQACKVEKASSLESIKYVNYLLEEIEKEDFFVGKIKSDEIILRNRDFKEIKKIKINYIGKRIKIIGINKENELIYFAKGGAVDDSYGILYSNKKIEKVGGVKYLREISDNLYEYSTWEK